MDPFANFFLNRAWIGSRIDETKAVHRTFKYKKRINHTYLQMLPILFERLPRTAGELKVSPFARDSRHSAFQKSPSTLDLDTEQINSFAIEWLHRIPDEDTHAGVLIISGQCLMYTKWQQRDCDRRYWPQFLRCNRYFFWMIQWEQEER